MCDSSYEPHDEAADDSFSDILNDSLDGYFDEAGQDDDDE